MNFHTALPIFNVKSLTASKQYFQEILGFNQSWDYEGIVCSMTRGDCEIFLVEEDQGGGNAWIFVGVGNADDLYQEYEKKGAKIRQPPTNFPWGCEMQIADLDNNVIRFCSDVKKDMSFGPWLDMNGKTWKIDEEAD